MQYLVSLAILIGSYLLGSIPFGLLVVRLTTGKDIRKIESGRTGGTNAMRAAGVWSGIVTAFLDGIKSVCAVWLSRLFLPGQPLLEVLAPSLVVLGHNYSIFLVERNPRGKLRLRGGAGGAPTVGGALGLWAPSVLIIVPLGLLIWLGVGYASLTTLSVAVSTLVIFIIRAQLGISPWQYIFYGIITLILLIIALRPNIVRLIKGTERIVGLRARRTKMTEAQSPK